MENLSEQEIIYRGIRADLVLAGITFADIGRDLGLARQTVRAVAAGLSRRAYIRQAIVEAIGRDPWGSNGDSRKN